jgi:polygalacturonase
MQLLKLVRSFSIIFVASFFSLYLHAADYIASANGVIADGSTNNAKAIQTLIDKCSAEGGGKVIIDKGTVVSGMITLKNNVNLKIAEGATLMNTGSKDDYPYVPVDFLSYYPERRAMVYAQNQTNIAVTGKGTIDGNCSKYKSRSSESARVSLIRFDGCKEVEVKDITLTNASMWTQHFYRTDNLKISGLTIKNHTKNDDGINVDGCHNVTIDNCDITTHDDAITLKNCSHRASKNVTVTNCRLNSIKSAFKFGTESYDGFINVTARNLKIKGGRDAIALFSVDGAKIENILIEDIEITDTKCPIVVFLGRRLRKIKGDEQTLKVGSVNGITIRNVKATGVKKAIILSGINDHNVNGIKLENVTASFVEEPAKAPKKRKKQSKRKKKKESAQPASQAEIKVKVDEKGYPSSSLFGTLNAWGLFVRNADNISLTNVNLTFEGKTTAHKAYLEKAGNVVLPENIKSEATFK